MKMREKKVILFCVVLWVSILSISNIKCSTSRVLFHSDHPIYYDFNNNNQNLATDTSITWAPYSHNATNPVDVILSSPATGLESGQQKQQQHKKNKNIIYPRSSPVCHPTRLASFVSNKITNHSTLLFYNHENETSSSVKSNVIRRIFFAHTRKAGGTYVKNILTYVSKLYNLTLVKVEGLQGWESPQRQDTLYVTNLRHPVSRIISDYKYEGRWDCGQIVSNRTFQPTLENSQSLKSFIEKSAKPNGCKSNNKDHTLMWRCSRLCYLRTFGGKKFNCLRKDDLMYNYKTALSRLKNHFHLVVITEWLHDATYRESLLQYFGINPNLKFDKMMYCGKESKHWNTKFPVTIKNDTLQKLYRVNALDIQLYNKLISCHGDNDHSNGVLFPPPPPRVELIYS